MERINKLWESRREDIAALYYVSCEAERIDWAIENGYIQEHHRHETNDVDDVIDEIRNDYALGLDYVEPEGREPGYWRYLLSTGGPQEVIRFYSSPMLDGSLRLTSASFHLIDWNSLYTLDITEDEAVNALWDHLTDIFAIA